MAPKRSTKTGEKAGDQAGLSKDGGSHPDTIPDTIRFHQTAGKSPKSMEEFVRWENPLKTMVDLPANCCCLFVHQSEES